LLFFLERFRVGDPESNNTPPLIQLVAFFPRTISQSTGNLGSFFFLLVGVDVWRKEVFVCWGALRRGNRWMHN
jgi:hypothetical protein